MLSTGASFTAVTVRRKVSLPLEGGSLAVTVIVAVPFNVLLAFASGVAVTVRLPGRCHR